MAIPVFESDWTANNSGGNTVTSLVLTKPVGAATGDIIVAVLGDDADGLSATDWSTPSSPDVWQYGGHFAGDGTADATLTLYWRAVDETEASTTTFQNATADESYGWMFRVSGADTSSPIHAFLATAGATGSTYTIDGVTTSIDDCLIVACMGEDGGDGGTFSINTGAGWAITDQENSGTGSQDGAGLIAQRDQASQGGGVDLLIDSAVTDGKCGFQIAFAPVSPDTDVAAITEELTLTPYQADIAVDVDVQANVETLTLTTYQATVLVSNDTDIQANVEELTLTPYQATITLDVDILANAEALTLTPYQATIAVDVDIQANVEALTLTPYQATVDTNVDILANVEALTLTSYQATVTLDVDIPANVEALTITTYQATISTVSDVDVQANTEALTLTTYQATVAVDVDVQANVEALTLTPYQATVAVDVDVLANVEALTLTTHQATISAVSDTDVIAHTEILSLTTYQADISVEVEETDLVQGIGGWVERYEWEEGERDQIERDDQRDLRRIVHEAFHGKPEQPEETPEPEEAPGLTEQIEAARKAALDFARLKGLALSIEALEALLDSYLAQLAREAEEAEEDDIAILLLMMA